ncbi:hypothetical protein EC988_000177 [Linderina pennispora]|nr:hypothetical protein EC988_000177 [Linderina pennispora]
MFLSPQAIRPVRTPDTQHKGDAYALPSVAAPQFADVGNAGRLKPRSYTASNLDTGSAILTPSAIPRAVHAPRVEKTPSPIHYAQPMHQAVPRKPRVSSMFVGGDLIAQLEREVERASPVSPNMPKDIPRHSSRDNSDFVEMKPAWVQSSAANQHRHTYYVESPRTMSPVHQNQPSPRPISQKAQLTSKPRAVAVTSDTNNERRPPASHPSNPGHSGRQAVVMAAVKRPIQSDESPQAMQPGPLKPGGDRNVGRSELIEFIERRRAKTVAVDAPPLPLAPAPINTAVYSKQTKVVTPVKAEQKQHPAVPVTSDTETDSAYSSSTANSTALCAAISATAAASTEFTGKKVDKSGSISSFKSDSSDRKYARSTARLADVDPKAVKTKSSDSSVKSNKYLSWYGANVPSLRSSTDTIDGMATSPRVTPAADAFLAPVASKMHLPPSLPQSTRIQQRQRAQTEVMDDKPARRLEYVSTRSPARKQLEAVSTAANGYARQKRPEPVATPPASLPALAKDVSYNPYARKPQSLAVAVQTDEDMPPPKPPVASRDTQTDVTSADAIHNDEAVLDLLKRMDMMRQTHSNQISEYQEQLVDLELINQELSNEVEHLSARIEAQEASHRQITVEMREKLDQERARVDREISDVKQMHAAKCNELGSQVSMLLRRAERYRERLVAEGVGEKELLELASDHSAEGRDKLEDLQITDQDFIETHYVETRESRQEADYFKQLMDIERSMENTTLALGFELKRTQAKYLQQAADFIREQMAKLQAENRAESRLPVAKPEPRASPASVSPPAPAIMSSHEEDPVEGDSEAMVEGAEGTVADDDADEHELPAGGYASPVQNLVASLSEFSEQRHFAAPKPGLPLAPSLSSTASSDGDANELLDRQIGDAFVGSRQRSFTALPSMMLPRAATLSSAFSRTSTASGFSPASRGVAGSEGRQSGLARLVASASESQTADPEITVGSARIISGPVRSPRSPLADIADKFFESSPTIVTPTTATPTRQRIDLFGTFAARSSGFNTWQSPGGRHTADASKPETPTKSGTVHWPPSSPRRTASRPGSVVLDSQALTTEELLESLKLPAMSAGTALSAPTRNGTPPPSIGRSGSPFTASLGRSASPFAGSLGRGSMPVNLAGSESARQTLHSRMASMTAPIVGESPESDVTLSESRSVGAFDASIFGKGGINLGLDAKPAATLGLSHPRNQRQRRGQRRRSKSVGHWHH